MVLLDKLFNSFYTTPHKCLRNNVTGPPSALNAQCTDKLPQCSSASGVLTTKLLTEAVKVLLDTSNQHLGICLCRQEAFEANMAACGRMAAASTLGMGGLFYVGTGTYGGACHARSGREERYYS